MRTAQLDGAHVEFFRGIRNPIGVKVGPAMTPEWLQRPARRARIRSDEPGRLTLIHRIGAQERRRRSCRRWSRRCARRAARCCGSATRCTATPRPRRAASRRGASTTSSRELEQAFEIHEAARLASSAACTSSSPARTSPSASAARAASPRPTSSAPTSRSVDPRLNYEQALEIAMLIGGRLRTHD